MKIVFERPIGLDVDGRIVDMPPLQKTAGNNYSSCCQLLIHVLPLVFRQTLG
jgi:hypothetical protein